jgi:hypothetical protein
MTFLHPEFLWGLFALAIPIAVHLFHFRRFKKVDFTNVKFLKEVKKDKESRRKLKHYLVLASRILAITFLVLAFAMPLRNKGEDLSKAKQKYVSIYLDNSLSMRAYGKEGVLHETAKNLARKIVEGYAPTDRFQILSNEMTGSEMRYVDQEGAIDKIDEMEISSSSNQLEKVLNIQKNNFHEANSGTLHRFVISDFQKSVANFNLDQDTLQTYLVPLKLAHQENLGIDSCWFKTPVMNTGSEVNLVARLHNYGNEVIEEASVSLKVNGMTKGSASANIPSRGYKDIELSFKLEKKGINKAELSLIGDERIFDDKRYFSFNVKDNSLVMIINGGESNEYLNRVFSNSPEISLSQYQEGGIDYSSISKNDLLILNETSISSSAFLDEVESFVEDGGNLLIIPGSNVEGQNRVLSVLNTSGLGELRQENVRFGDVRADHPFYEGVIEGKKKQNYSMGVKRYYKIASTEGGKLITLSNGYPFATLNRKGNGNVILLASPLNSTWSDFPKFSFYVPFMLRSTEYGSENERLYGIVGEKDFVKVMSSAEESVVIDYNGVELIPESKLSNKGLFVNASEEIKLAGSYNVKLKKNGDAVASLSYNYDTDESETAILSSEELEDRMPDDEFWFVLDSESTEFESKLLSHTRNDSVWRLCIIMVLIFLAIEVLLIRFVKL